MAAELSLDQWDERRKRLIQAPKLIGAAALLRRAKKEPDFLIPQRIPGGAITLVVGPRGSTKSWLVYDLALAVAQSGRRWLDKAPNYPGSPVIVLSYDNSTDETARRFDRLGLEGSDPIHFHSVDIDPWKMPHAAEQLTDICHELNPKLVIVDTFRQAVNGNENDSEEMGKVMGGFKGMIATPSKPAVVIVHHAAKGMALEGPSARGSGEIEGSADAVIAIEGGKAQWTKSRSWNMDPKFSLTYRLVDEGESTDLELVKK